MCSTCGGRRSRLPGARPANAIVLGEPNGATPTPVTFLEDHEHAKAGQYRYVTGDGIDAALDAGQVERGYAPMTRSRRQVAGARQAPQKFFVEAGRNRWIGFSVEVAAARYARTVGKPVLTREEVLALDTEPPGGTDG